ncbi:MAG: hypothetical protein KW804_01520 [Candidatus Doudnabacteria bacterium]|nr:hypothetical protein [Candidatus Doudnabacteria bacterium]
MQNINSKGSGLISLIIVIAIALVLVFGYRFMGKDGGKNQIEQGNEAIEQAKDAAEAEHQGSLYLENEIADPPPVNFHGVTDKARNLPE